MAERARRTAGPGRGEREAKSASRIRRSDSKRGRAPGSRPQRARRGPARNGAEPAGSGADGADNQREPGRVLPRGRGEKPKERTIAGLSTGRAAVLAVVIAALALTLAVPLRTYFTQRAEAARVAVERRQLEAEVIALQGRREQQQDPAYVRAQARDRLRLVMPGDTPYIVQLPGAHQEDSSKQTERRKPSGAWYTMLWHSISEKRK